MCMCVWKGGRKIGRERSATFRSAWIFDGVKVAGNPRHDRLNYWLISMAHSNRRKEMSRARRVVLYSREGGSRYRAFLLQA